MKYKPGDVILYKGCYFYWCVKSNIFQTILFDGYNKKIFSTNKLYKDNRFTNLGYINYDIKELNKQVYISSKEIQKGNRQLIIKYDSRIVNGEVITTVDYSYYIMADILGRELSVGDFVLCYRDNIDLPMPLFGIVYSDIEIFTKHGLLNVDNDCQIPGMIDDYVNNYVYKLNKEKYTDLYTELVQIHNLKMKHLLINRGTRKI